MEGRRPDRAARRALIRAVAVLATAVLVSCTAQTSPSTTPPGASPASAAVRSPAVASTVGSPALGLGNGRLIASTQAVKLPHAVSRAVAFAEGASFLVAGGLTSGGTTGDLIAVDLTGRVARLVGHLVEPVHDAAGSVLGGLPVLFGGGNLVPGRTVQSVRATNGKIVGHLPLARADLAVVNLDGAAIIVGGGTPARLDPEILSTTDGTHFERLGILQVGARYPAVGFIAGSIVMVGGSDGSRDLSVIQAFDPTTGVDRVIGHLPHGLSHSAAFVLGGRMFVAGGRFEGRAQDAIWEINPVTGGATVAGYLPLAISDAAAVVVGDAAYLAGGETSTFEASIIEVKIE